MKSSGPVFTRQNPFQSAPRVGKTHYNPSQKQAVTKKKKKTALSPVRLNQRPTADVHTPSPESQHTFEKRDHRFAARGGQPVYAESWPSTDCESTLTSLRTTSDMGTLKQSAKTRKTTVTPEAGVQEDSVLAKYIERFRHGQPLSREERRQMASAIGEEQLPFWWLSPSSLSPSSSPAEAIDKDVMEPLKDDHGPAIFSTPGPHQHDRTLSPCKTSLTICSDTTQGEFDDTEILHLQERASRLLLRGNCTLSDGAVPVSSEGLGCSDFSSPVSVDEPVRKPVIPSLTKFTSVKHSPDSVQAVSYQKSAIPSSATPNCPEEDILYQWRLRRKMEQAREWPQSVQHSNPYASKFIWQAPSLNYPSANRKAYKHRNHSPKYSQMATPLHMTAPQQEPTEAHESYLPAAGPFPNFVVSGSSVSQPQTIAHVPAHMHLLCDVLPCPIQLSNTSVQQNILQTSVDSKDRVVQKQKKVPRTSYVGPTLEHQSSSQPASSEAIEEELHSHQNRSERNRKENTRTNMLDKDGKKTVTSIKNQKRSTGNSEYSDKHNTTKKNFSHQRLPKKLIPWAEQRRHQGTQEFHSERCTLIHSALGQVVSEVLFPEDSSPALKTPVSLVSPPSDASAQSPGAVNSVEVILQLMQEAEDSDEKEFEDDPLLQVLRKQRKWVKEQISEVDSMLNGFLNKNK